MKVRWISLRWSVATAQILDNERGPGELQHRGTMPNKFKQMRHLSWKKLKKGRAPDSLFYSFPLLAGACAPWGLQHLPLDVQLARATLCQLWFFPQVCGLIPSPSQSLGVQTMAGNVLREINPKGRNWKSPSKWPHNFWLPHAFIVWGLSNLYWSASQD